MPCVVGKNSITCFRLPADARIRVKIKKTGEEYWCVLTQKEYEVRPATIGVTLWRDTDDGKHETRRFLKSYTEYVCNRDEWCEREVEKRK